MVLQMVTITVKTFSVIFEYIFYFLRGIFKPLSSFFLCQPTFSSVCKHPDDNFTLAVDTLIQQYDNDILLQLKELNSIDEVVDYILKRDAIEEDDVIAAVKANLPSALLKIKQFHVMMEEVELLRSSAYSSSDFKHEEDLYKLWENLCPGVELSGRFTNQWTEIGFQGKDPATDFRGMGLLGLHLILYFSKTYPKRARRNLSLSQHPTNGYFFAIVAINVGKLLLDLTKDGKFKPILYGQRDRIDRELFFRLFSTVFVEFNEFWFSEQRNIMEYNAYQDQFSQQLCQRIAADPTSFTLLQEDLTS